MKALLLMDKKGGYLALGTHTESKFMGGFFWQGNEFFRILEDIRIVDQETAESIEKRGGWGIRQWSQGASDHFCMEGNTILFDFKGKREREIVLDVKKSYDNRSFGRFYEVKEDNDCVLVHFRKSNDLAEPERNDEYDLYLALAFSEPKWEFTKYWKKRFYTYDAEREGSGERYAYSLLKTSVKRMILVIGKSETEVKNELNKQRKFLTKRLRIPEKEEEQSITSTASEALSGLITDQYGRDGILAGFPWFFQYWTRDEAISARAVFLMGKEKIAKKILLGYLENIDEEGRIPNRIPAADLGCADGVGWVFLRLKELFKLGKISEKETAKVIMALEISLYRLEQHLEEDGLIRNRALETWMDTVCEGDTREGSRIEIQALTLAMREFLVLLTNDVSAAEKLSEHQNQTRNIFWNGQWLRDGKNDDTLRPNLFIACYAFPQLLSGAEWESCFDAALNALWLPWGGLATIDKTNPLFCSSYSGQNNRSYHRGDSWFFLNALAGICLHKVNPVKYAKYIQKILDAAKSDMNETGAIGCASELSSAEKQTSAGCWNQAWSNAMFIELSAQVARSQNSDDR